MNIDEVNDKITETGSEKPSLTSSHQDNAQMALVVSTDILNQEAVDLINQIIVESDTTKAKDLTTLFNVNQNKKALIRTSKLSELYDILTEQALIRFRNKPDEISNQELLAFLKVLQDLLERSQKQATGTEEKPLITINSQTNNIGDGLPKTKESRDKISSVIVDILKNLNSEKDVVDADVVDLTSGGKKNE